MSYFDKIPFTEFEIKRKEKVLVRDFVRAVKIDPAFLNDASLFTPYNAKDEETPEVISYNFYGTVAYHWVIALINGKYDYLNDYPRSELVLREYVVEKYGTLNKVHHYEDLNGNWVDNLPGGAEFKIPVTVLEYEKKENESKRTMKILRKELLTEFVNTYESAISR